MNLTFRILQHTSSEVTDGKIINKFKRKRERLVPNQGNENKEQTDLRLKGFMERFYGFLCTNCCF